MAETGLTNQSKKNFLVEKLFQLGLASDQITQPEFAVKQSVQN